MKGTLKYVLKSSSYSSSQGGRDNRNLLVLAMVKSAGSRLFVAFKDKAVSWISLGGLSTGIWSCSLSCFAVLKRVTKAHSRGFCFP